MNMFTKQWGLIAVAVMIVLVTTGCAPGTKTKSHVAAVNAASQRWKDARSLEIIKMAQQYFDTGDLERAETTLIEAVTVDPKNPYLHLLAGRVAMERGNLERSYSRLQTAIELDPKLPDPHYYQGIVLQRWRRFDRALEQYQAAFDLVPDSVPYLLAVSEMYVATNQIDRAIELTESKLVYFENSSAIRLAMGQLYIANQRYSEAASMFRQAWLLKPGDPVIAEELAMAQVRAGESGEAINTLRTLMNENKEYKSRGDLQLVLANAYEQVGQREMARETYLALRRSEPQRPEPWIKLAELAWADGKLADAQSAAEQSIALAPQRYEGYLLSGLVWQKRGHSASALEMFEMASERAPQSAEPMLMLGITHQRAGRTGEAAKAYAEALRREPDDHRAARLLASLDVTSGD